MPPHTRLPGESRGPYSQMDSVLSDDVPVMYVIASACEVARIGATVPFPTDFHPCYLGQKHQAKLSRFANPAEKG